MQQHLRHSSISTCPSRGFRLSTFDFGLSTRSMIKTRKTVSAHARIERETVLHKSVKCRVQNRSLPRRA